ncbi:hypothetical protein GCM10027040_00570 [Halomonas shantousis]
MDQGMSEAGPCNAGKQQAAVPASMERARQAHEDGTGHQQGESGRESVEARQRDEQGAEGEGVHCGGLALVQGVVRGRF